MTHMIKHPTQFVDHNYSDIHAARGKRYHHHHGMHSKACNQKRTVKSCCSYLWFSKNMSCCEFIGGKFIPRRVRAGLLGRHNDGKLQKKVNKYKL
jgi:hypothetical protein